MRGLAHALGELGDPGLALALDVVFDLEYFLVLAALLALKLLDILAGRLNFSPSSSAHC